MFIFLYLFGLHLLNIFLVFLMIFSHSFLSPVPLRITPNFPLLQMAGLCGCFLLWADHQSYGAVRSMYTKQMFPNMVRNNSIFPFGPLLYRPIQARKCWAPCATAAVYLCLILCTKTRENRFPFHFLWKFNVFLNNLCDFSDMAALYAIYYILDIFF